MGECKRVSKTHPLYMSSLEDRLKYLESIQEFLDTFPGQEKKCEAFVQNCPKDKKIPHQKFADLPDFQNELNRVQRALGKKISILNVSKRRRLLSTLERLKAAEAAFGESK